MGSSSTAIPNIREAVPFFMISDMVRSLKFYQEGLGFIMTHKWIPRGRIEWCSLKRGGASIMLQELRKDVAQGYQSTQHFGQGVSICFFCDDAIQLYHEFKMNGLQPARPFVGNGLWVTSLPDPDGYQLHFESYTEIPEETVYDPEEQKAIS